MNEESSSPDYHLLVDSHQNKNIELSSQHAEKVPNEKTSQQIEENKNNACKNNKIQSDNESEISEESDESQLSTSRRKSMPILNWTSLSRQNKRGFWKSCWNDEDNYLSNFCLKRTRLRYIAMCFIPLAIFLSFLIIFQMSSVSGIVSFDLQNQVDLNIQIVNCRVYLKNSRSNVLSFSYSQFRTGSSNDRTNTVFEENQEEGSISAAISSDSLDLKNCNMEVFLSDHVRSLNIDCSGELCVVIRENEGDQKNYLTLEDFNVSAPDGAFLNLENIAVRKFDFNIARGGIQINGLNVSQGSINLSFGDIILHSDLDMRVEFQNAVQAFCVAAPFFKENETNNCFVADEDSTERYSSSSNCSGIFHLCKTPDECQQFPSNLSISQETGNLYINLLTSLNTDISYQDYILMKGGIYLSGPDFSPMFKNELEDVIAEAFNETSGDPNIILNLGGNEYALFSYTSLWTFIANPSFAYMRPWWLATFSASLLTTNTLKRSDSLVPGLCPFHNSLNVLDVQSIQKLIERSFNSNSSVISLVNKASWEQPSMTYRNISGIYVPQRERLVSEEWLSVESDQFGKLYVISNEVTSNGYIIAAIVLSFLVAFVIGVSMIFIFKAGIIIILQQIIQNLNHNENYKQFLKNKSQENNELIESLEPKEEQEEETSSKFNLQNLLKISSFVKFMQRVPRISSFVGHYSVILAKRYLINSVSEFYDHLLNPNLPDVLKDYQLGKANLKYLEIKEKNLKNLYEKFCFLNNYQENPLSSETSIAKLKKYGYVLEDDIEESMAFTHLIEKSEKTEIDPKMFEKNNSLEVFFQSFCLVTANDFDYIYSDDLEAHYNDFCQRYKAERLIWKIDMISQRFNLGVQSIKRKILRRKSRRNQEKQPFNGKEFFIDEEMLNFHFEVLMNPEKIARSFEARDSQKNNTQSYILNRMIYYSRWYYWVLLDCSIIAINILVSAALIIPFLGLSLLYETSYSAFSTISPESLVSSSEILETPWEVMSKLWCLMGWNQGIVVICIVYMIISFLDSFFFFFFSYFPEERSFIANQSLLEKNFYWKISANIQWILIFFIIFCYSSYVGLACVWLTLGAIINPNNFLVYATSALTFLIFVRTKYVSFQTISQNGFVMIQEIISNILHGQIKEIVTLMITETTNFMNDNQPDDFSKLAAEKAEEFGLIEEVGILRNIKADNTGKESESTEEGTQQKVEKLHVLSQKIKDKARKIFEEKCVNAHIPEDVIKIFMYLNLGEYEKLNFELSELIENNSEKTLGVLISKDLILALLEVLRKIGGTNTPERNSLIVENFIMEIMAFLIGEKLPKEVKPQKKEKKILFEMISFISAVKMQNKKRLIRSLNNILISLDVFPPEQMKPMNFLIQIMDILISNQDKIKMKASFLNIMNQIYLPVPVTNIIGLLLRLSYHNPIIEFKDIKLSTTEHLKFFFAKFYNDFKPENSVFPEEDMEFISKTSAILVRVFKSQFTGTDYLNVKKVLLEQKTGFFAKSVISLKKTMFEGLFDRFLGVIPFMISIGKDFKAFWREVANKLNVENSLVEELIAIMTEEYYQILMPFRSEAILSGKLSQSFAKKLKLKKECLLGLIDLFYGSLESTYADMFLREIFNSEGFDKWSLLQQKKLKELTLIVLSKNPFFIRKKILSIDPEFDLYESYEYLCKMDKSFSLIFQDPNYSEMQDEANNNNNNNSDSPNNNNQLRLSLKQSQSKHEGNTNKNQIFIGREKSIEEPPISKTVSVEIKMESEKIVTEEKIPNKFKFPANFQKKLFAKEQILDIEYLLEKLHVKAGFSDLLAKADLMDFLKQIKNLFDIKFLKDDLSKSVMIKLRISGFCARFGFDEESWINFVYLISHDPNKSVQSLMFFLQSELQLEENQVSFLIQNLHNEEKMMKNTINALPLYLQKWIPKKMLTENSAPILFKGIFQKTWTTIDKKPIIEFLKLLIEVYTPGSSKEDIEENQKRILAMLYLSEKPDLIGVLFPILQEPGYKIAKGSITNFLSIISSKEKDLRQVSHFLSEYLFKEFKNIEIDQILELALVFRFFSWREDLDGYPFCLHADKDFENEFSSHFSIDFSLLKAIRSYFTINASAFSEEMIIHFIKIHGIDTISQSKLCAFLDICNDSIHVDQVSKLLKVPPYEIESLNLVREYYFSKQKGVILEKIRESFVSKRWCLQLNIVFKEFIDLITFFNQELSIMEIRSFLIYFDVNRTINFELLVSLFSLFLKDQINIPIQMRELHYRKLFKTRDFLYKILEVNSSLANIQCDLIQKRFWFVSQQIQYNPIFIELELIPSDQSRKTAEVICGLLGTVLNDNLHVYDLRELIQLCISKQIDLGNNLETACYLLYQNYGISPICVLIFLNQTFARKFLRNQDPTLAEDVEKMRIVFDEMSFSEKMMLVEEEWMIEIYENAKNLRSKLISKAFDKEKTKELEFLTQKKNEAKKKINNLMEEKGLKFREIFEKLNMFCFPIREKGTLFARVCPYNSLVMLSCLHNLKESVMNHRPSDFVIYLDLALNCCEKIKFMRDSPLLFEPLRKNAWIKLIFYILFPETQYEDFTHEFFLLPCLFESSFIEKIRVSFTKHKNETFMLPNYLSDFFIFSKNNEGKSMEDIYLRNAELYKDIDRMLKNELNLEGTYELLLSQFENGEAKYSEGKKKLLQELVEWKKQQNSRYQDYHLMSIEALEINFNDNSKIDWSNPIANTLQKIENLEHSDEKEKYKLFFSFKSLKRLHESHLLSTKNWEQSLIGSPEWTPMKIAEFLSIRFQNMFLGEFHTSQQFFMILVYAIYCGAHDIYLEPSIIDCIIDNISNKMTSDYHNIKLLIRLFMDRKVKEKEIAKILGKMKIKDSLFFGLLIPYGKMLFSFKEYDGNIIQQIPECITELIIDNETIQGYIQKVVEEQNQVDDIKANQKGDNLFGRKSKENALFTIYNKLENSNRNDPFALLCLKKSEEKDKSLHIEEKVEGYLRNLFLNTDFSSKEKDHLILLLKSYYGDKESFKKMILSLNGSLRKQTNLFENLEGTKKSGSKLKKLLDIVDLFSHTRRKNYSFEDLKNYSLFDLMDCFSSSNKAEVLYRSIYKALGWNKGVLKELPLKSKMFILKTVKSMVEQDFVQIPTIFDEKSLITNRLIIADCFNVADDAMELTIVKLSLLILGLSNEKYDAEFIKFLNEIAHYEFENLEKALLGKIPGNLYILFIKLIKGNYSSLYKGLAQLGDLNALGFLFLMNMHRVFDVCLSAVTYAQRIYMNLFIINSLLEILNLLTVGMFGFDLKGLEVYEELQVFLKEKVIEAYNQFKAIISKFEGDREFSWFNLHILDYLHHLWVDLQRFIENEGKFLKAKWIRDLARLAEVYKGIVEVYEKIRNFFGQESSKTNKVNNEFFIRFFFPLFIATTGYIKVDMHYSFLEEFDGIIENFAKMHFKNYAFEFKVLLKSVILSNERFSKENKNQPSSIFFYLLQFYDDLEKICPKNKEYAQMIELFRKIFVVNNTIRDVSDEEYREFFRPLLKKLVKSIFKSNKREIKQDILKRKKDIDAKDLDVKFDEMIFLSEKEVSEIKINYSLFYLVVTEVEEFLADFNELLLIHDTSKINKVAQRLGILIFPKDLDLTNLIRSLIYLFLGDLEHIDLILLRLLKINYNQISVLKTLSQEFQSVLKPTCQVIERKLTNLSMKGQNPIRGMEQVMNKINSGQTVTNGDLFKAIDIDQSGKISLEEFRLLTKRLRMNLSEHRIIEIFTTVSKNPEISSRELDEKEFELALNYLQNKSIMMTLETLGITQELLVIILIWLTILLLLIFAFIFVGIKAFAIGGTFGAIINSLFPIAGGVGLSKEGDSKERSLNQEKMEELAAECMQIVSSFSI